MMMIMMMTMTIMMMIMMMVMMTIMMTITFLSVNDSYDVRMSSYFACTQLRSLNQRTLPSDLSESFKNIDFRPKTDFRFFDFRFSNFRFIDLSIYRFIDLSIYRYIDISMYRYMYIYIYPLVVIRCFFEAHFQLRFLSLLGGLLGGFGRSWRPKGPQEGVNREPKAWKKWSPEGLHFSHSFLIDFSSKNVFFSSGLSLLFFMHCLADWRGKRVSVNSAEVHFIS